MECSSCNKKTISKINIWLKLGLGKYTCSNCDTVNTVKRNFYRDGLIGFFASIIASAIPFSFNSEKLVAVMALYIIIGILVINRFLVLTNDKAT